MTARGTGLILIVTAHLGLLASPLPAWAFWRTEGPSHTLHLGGSIRTVAAALDNYEEALLFGSGNDLDGLSETALRLTADGGLGKRGGYEIHLVQKIAFTTTPSGRGGPSFNIAGAGARYRALDLSATLAEEDDFVATVFLDRLNGHGSRGRVDLTFGRQAINFSQAYFWNPLDIFLPFDPEAFDRAYKPGVDAIRADLTLGPFSSLTLVAAAGNRLLLESSDGALEVGTEDFFQEPWYGSALLARARTTLRHWDATLQGGKVYGGWMVGAGFSGEVGLVGLRGELTYCGSDDDPSPVMEDGPIPDEALAVSGTTSHAKVVVGADHRFVNSLYVNAEYFYNGAGEDEDLARALPRVALGETTNLGRHYLGLQASYDLHPLLVGQVAWIHSFTDGSDLLSPTFTWSLSSETECVFGAILAFGERPQPRAALPLPEAEMRSEFGTFPNWYFLELIHYF